MSGQNFGEAAGFISNYLKLKTSPVAVKFLKSKADFPEKTRRPSVALGKRVAVCQAVTMARLYGWTVGLTKEDIVCIPAAFAFGYSDAEDTAAALGKLFGIGSYTQTEEIGRAEAQTIQRLAKDEYEAILLAPLARATFAPDTIVFYGNPAQIMKLVQAWTYDKGKSALLFRRVISAARWSARNISWRLSGLRRPGSPSPAPGIGSSL